ncbi:telomerase reverse transcriptase isoform X5 [Physcomitrium patens]|uniref:telomerase reverse transcriptase isoform X5 n=1 Tax=Physcomitrium patens TaxID=3218 RepID=UPI000D15B0C6|nr:telomerase reverse transcriptase-like isoform X5 [Physcomitrium patens]|eukprot:XP_024376582.1 telomerase reverse transcriptase-like isoform X5 [Physcomitrella patens]
MRKRKVGVEEGNRDPERCPYHLRLLRNLYGTLLRSLQEVVQDLGDGEEMGLVRDDDSVEYLILLKRSFALLPDGALERVGRGEAMNQRWSQQQVVERSIQLHLREGASSNVLCFGYGQVQSAGSKELIPAFKGLEHHHYNVATAFISTHLWVTLLARIGEERMLYLLSNAAIFVPLPNYCLLQVAGHAFNMTASIMKQLPQSISIRTTSHGELSTVLQQKAPNIEQRNSYYRTEKLLRLQDANEVPEDMTLSRKRARPSSWVRRKQWRRQTGTHFVCQRREGLAEGLDDVDPVIFSHCTVDKVELPKPVHRVGFPPRIIDRSAIFYHSSFSCHAGLPANHILNTSSTNEADISRVLGSVFPALDIAATASERGSLLTAGNVTKDNLIKNVKGLLRKMVQSAKHCNYARLLSKHCPLPSYSALSLPKVKTPRLQDKKQMKSNVKGLNLLMERYFTQEKDDDYLLINSLGSSKKNCNLTRSSRPLSNGPIGGPYLGEIMHPEYCRKPVVNEGIPHEKDKATGRIADLGKLVTLSSTHSEVVNFLWAVCRSLLPESFLGCNRFRRKLCSGIASFVSLRRHENFHIQHFLNELQSFNTAWPCFSENGRRTRKISLKDSDTHALQMKAESPGCPSYAWDLPQTMLQDWLHWLFTEMIIPLLRSHFYITEAENHRQNVLYYRKPVWAKIQMLSLNHLVVKCYRKLDPTTVAAVLQKRVLGFSHVRMLPKHNGVRPIANLSSRTRCALPLITGAPKDIESSALCGKRRRTDLIDSVDYLVKFRSATRRNILKQVSFAFKSINSRLKGVHTCLKYEQETHLEDLGASVFGYKDAYSKLLPYISHLKSLPGGLPQMYMAVCDISRAYDTIKQDKLCEVVSGFLRLPVYHIRRYATIFNFMGSTRASYKQICTTSDQQHDILKLFMELAARRSHSILQDQGMVTRLKQSQILGLIEEHVKRNIVKIGPHFYLQKTGIAQGSVLSPLLCSIFFGHLDEHVLMPLLQQPASVYRNDFRSQQEGENEVEISSARLPSDLLEVPKVIENGETILLRLIDDSLFISTSQSSVARFVQLMHDGFEEYGCYANRQKTAVSFDLLLNKNQEKIALGVYMTSDGARFMRWGGLLINCCTLEVQADYTRYIGEPIKGTITVVRKKNPGAQVPIKLCHFVRAKSHPILYDLRINSPSTVRLNAYQAFLLCAMKFHAYLCSMERTCCHHSPFLLQAIEVTSSYMHGLLRKQMQEMGASAHLGMTKDEMTWLALHAFLKVLHKKQSRYTELLFLIQERLGTPKYAPLSYCPHLASARDDNRSTMFKLIIY